MIDIDYQKTRTVFNGLLSVESRELLVSNWASSQWRLCRRYSRSLLSGEALVDNSSVL